MFEKGRRKRVEMSARGEKANEELVLTPTERCPRCPSMVCSKVILLLSFYFLFLMLTVAFFLDLGCLRSA